MNTFAIVLLALCFLGLMLCFIALADAARATEILEDFDNQRKIRKCFGQEGLQIYFNFSNHTCSVSFHHKGTHYHRDITFAKAVALFNSYPKGQGLRKLFVEKTK